jgi:hypothetical protein
MHFQAAFIEERLVQAKSELAEIQTLERNLRTNHDAILCHAWELGRILTDLKEEIGHGKWLFWLGGNWPELGERNARRCMVFFKANETWKNLKSAEFRGFERDSIRKFMWGYIPAKERLELPGDVTDSPAPHHLTPVNQFTKYYRQVRSGLGDWPDKEVFRREIEPTLEIIRILSGAAKFKVTSVGVSWIE